MKRLIYFMNVFFVLFIVVLAVEAQDLKIIENKVWLSNDDTQRVNQLNKTSFSFIQKNVDSVFHYGLLAKSMSEEINYPAGHALALLYLSMGSNQKGNYQLAMENALSALNIYDSLQMDAQMGHVYIQLAYIYKTMASQYRTPSYLNTGFAYSKQALEKYNISSDTAGIANSLNMRGILYRDKYYAENDPAFFDSALENYQKAISLINVSGKGEKHLGKLYNNISQVYNEYKKEYGRGLSFLFRAVKFNEARNNKVSLLYNYGNISATYKEIKEYDKALVYAKKMLIISQEMAQPNRMHDALYELFQIYEVMGRHKEALKNYILAARITDSLNNIEKTQQVTQLRAEYETEKKELEIEQLNLEKSNSKKRIVFLTSGLGLFFLLTVSLVLLFRRVQSQKRKISLQSTRLEVMMKELHHRVKNNLQIVSSLLGLQTYKSDDERTISVLKESQQRVQAMSLIHQRLYNTGDLMAVDMKEYITDLAESLLSSFGYQKDNFDLEINIETGKLDVEKAIPLGLIINEMITNAMKYAYTGVRFPELIISLKTENNDLVLKIKDNGKGMDTHEWQQKTNSFGKQLIQALGRQLRAEQEISVEEGTQFTLIIPITKAA